jgi:GT2 family glycosyltransferase/glycosyltransferase involved in cell wall biosynthesis
MPRTSGDSAALSEVPLDVVVPVYFAHAEFRRCVSSLERHTDLARHRVIVVLDGPGQDEAREAVQLSAASDSFLILQNARRGGFVVSANRGMAASDRDVILLNSDTEVTAGWVEKLQAAAVSDGAVATVTPFSNNATLASLPRPFEVNALPSGHDVDSFARVVESASRRAYPRLPTAVGVCMLIRRAVLRAIGPFDEERFGLGYGEENDFCMRASRAGFVHVLDDATFVYHAGQRSFGASRPALARAAMRALTEAHPDYLPRIAAFMKADPLRETRQRVLNALRRPRAAAGDGVPRRMVHVVHGWPPWDRAGTETYARGLAVRQAASREVAVYARMADPVRERGEATELLDHGARVRLVVNNFTQRDPLSRNAIRDARIARDFGRFLDEEAPELVHVHHLAGHGAGLASVLRARRIPYVYQLQDWWSLCARTNLLDASRRACAGPAPSRCARCLPLTGIAPAALWSNLLYRRRVSVLRAALAGASAVVMGSEAILDSFRALGWLAPDAGRVIPYGIEPPPAVPARGPAARPLRFATIGSVMPHKGAHVAVAAFRAVAPDAATLDVWGDDHLLPDYARELRALASTAVRFRGTFAEEAREDVFAATDVLIAPSLGLESFGLVVAEAQARGVPVLASRRGALVERVRDGVDGALFDPDDPGALAAEVSRLAASPEIVDRWRSALPLPKTMDAHALEIDAVYAAVRARR